MLPAAAQAYARSCHVLGRAQHKLGRPEEARASWHRGVLALARDEAHPRPAPPADDAERGPSVQRLMVAPPEAESDDEATPRLLAVYMRAVSVGCV